MSIEIKSDILAKELNQGIVPLGVPKAYQYDAALVEAARAAVNQGIDDVAEAGATAVTSVKAQESTSKTNINTLGDKILAQMKHGYGYPFTAATAAAMTDTAKIYVYTGAETGYTNGNWYYWNGTAWTSGGVYNATALETDKTLTVSGAAADSLVVGRKISEDYTQNEDRIDGILSSNDIHDIGNVTIYAKSGQRYLSKYFDFADLTIGSTYVVEMDSVVNNLQTICGEIRFLDDNLSEISHIYIYATALKTLFTVPQNTHIVRIYAHAALAEYFTEDKTVYFKNIRIYKGTEIELLSTQIHSSEKNIITLLSFNDDFIEGNIDGKGRFNNNPSTYSNIRYCTKQYYKADSIILSNYLYSSFINIIVYSEKREDAYIETVSFSRNVDTVKYNVNGNCYVRFLLTTNNTNVTLANYVDSMAIALINGDRVTTVFDDEIEDTISKVLDNINNGSIVLPIITDTHDDLHNADYHNTVVTSIANIKVLSRNLPIDAIVHLGDFVNQGYYTQTENNNSVYRLINNNIDDLHKINNKLLIAVGNHDGALANSNYNTDFLYKCNGKTGYSYSKYGDGEYHYYDIPNRKVRLIFLAIPDDNYYGPSVAQLNWLKDTALNTPDEYNVFIFSHIGNMCNMYSKNVLEGIVTAYNNHSTYIGTAYGGTVIEADFSRYVSTKVICAISGHVHGDSVFAAGASSENGAVNGFPCPTITIGAGGFITSSAIIPEAVAPARAINTYTEILFDLLVYNIGSNSLKLIRFGAGSDRTVSV